MSATSAMSDLGRPRWMLAAVAAILIAGVRPVQAQGAFVAQRWTGAWGSDGPIFTGDLNGDGKTDVFMWRDADKSWTVNLSTGSGFAMQRWTGAWGSDGPIEVGDLNGDGKTDVFMWRDADKSWTVNLSTGSGFVTQRWTGAWGSDGPIHVGDLNGDGTADVFMWRDADKSWTVNLSTGSGFVMQRWTGAWGSDGPIEVGDLNGDGKTDVFMWRDVDKSWTVNLSTGTGFAMQRWTGAWGSDGPIRVGDLDGDGKTDVFMWRDVDKSWTVNLSTGTGFAMQRWLGACGSDGTVVQGDFNGDHRQDIAVWRDDFKRWMTSLSTAGGLGFQIWDGAWGSDGPIFTGDLNGDGKTDVFMWRDIDKSWTINLGVAAAPGRVATAPACGSPAWVSLGPDAMTGELNYKACSGKIDDIQLSPDYDGRQHPAMYLAAASSSSFLQFGGGGGGVWRSTDFTAASPTWTPLLDHVLDPAITDAIRPGLVNVPSVAVDPSSPRRIYAATNTSPSALLASIDGGDSWKLIAQGQLGNGGISRVTVDPRGVVYVATSTGFYVSEDSGGSFTDVTGTLAGLSFSDVAWFSFDQVSFQVFAAAIDFQMQNASSRTGIFAIQKVAGSYTWQQTTLTLRNLQGAAFAASAIWKIQLAATPGAGVVASTTSVNNPGLQNVFKASLGSNGVTWTPQWTNPGIAFFTGAGYTLGVTAAPDGTIYAGGIGIGQSDGRGGVVGMQSTDGGFAHVDEHVITYVPYDHKVYVGTDGGLFRFQQVPSGIVAWESVNSSSLRTMLSESVAVSPADPSVLVAGHQDNGMATSARGGWTSAGGNEGEAVYFDPNDTQGNTAYAFDASNQAFLKSTDGGKSFGSLAFGGGSNFALAFHPSQKDRFLVDFQTASNTYTIKEAFDGWANPANATDLAPPIASLGVPTALAYVGAYRYVAAGGSLFQGKDNGAGKVTWLPVPVFLAAESIVSVVADAANPDSIYVATSSRILRKQNQADGRGWSTAAGGGLEDLTGAGSTRVPFQIRKLALIASPGGSGKLPVLYAATIGGVFKSGPTSRNASWARLGTGLPDVLVSDLHVDATAHSVHASLFGRGLWSVTDYSK